MSRSPSATPNTKDDVLAIRRLDVLLSVFRYTRQFPSNIVPTVTATSTVMEDGAESECDTSLVLLDRRVCRVTGYLVHSDIVGKVLSLLREPLIGRHVKTLPIATSMCYGVAVNASETLMAVTSYSMTADNDRMFIYSLSSGELLKTIRGPVEDTRSFRFPARVCFGPDDVIIVANYSCNQVVEFTAAGDHKRTIDIADPFAVCVSHDQKLVGVGTAPSDGSAAAALLDYNTAECVRVIGKGTIDRDISSVCFTPDDTAIVAIGGGGSALMFTVNNGSFVRTLCRGLSPSMYVQHMHDVVYTDCGVMIVAEYAEHSLYVYNGDGSRLLRMIGGEGSGDGQFKRPIALTYVNGRLYVLDGGSPRVQVFE